MKILFAASEGAPYIKTGGLGDVIYALPNELANQEDTEIYIFLPYYKSIKNNPGLDIEYVTNFGVPLSWRSQYCGLFRCKGQKPNITYYFIDNEYYFNRDKAYGYYDDGERFAYFSKAILESLIHLDFTPDVIHLHDWQTALIPLWLKANYCHMERFQRIKTVFTIHNIEYQGKVPDAFFEEVLGLNPYWFNTVHYDTCLNFMKSAIVLADKVTTVSRTYSYEIRHAYFAHGLQNILQEYGYKVTGVVNGIDMDLYNAQTDPLITQNFEPGDLEGKAENKMALQKRLGLPVNKDIPMVAMISRLAGHKGLDLVEFVANDIMQLPLQFVVVGTGEERYQNLFYRLAWEHPDKMSANILFDPVLANQVYAGADLFLMPSQAEPCGLSQLISMRYGTIPIVRETGGLYDTVPALNPETMEGRGFTFKSYNAHDMLGSLINAINFYNGDKKKLKQLVTNLMNVDCSWKEPVKEYLAIYHSLF
ncbi:MAG: glycogen synthase GlgA [Massiliimalia sp.]|jgi:starch synthase